MEKIILDIKWFTDEEIILKCREIFENLYLPENILISDTHKELRTSRDKDNKREFRNKEDLSLHIICWKNSTSVNNSRAKRIKCIKNIFDKDNYFLVKNIWNSNYLFLHPVNSEELNSFYICVCSKSSDGYFELITWYKTNWYQWEMYRNIILWNTEEWPYELIK